VQVLASSGPPARAGTTASPALSPSWSRTCCNTLRQPLHRVAARDPAAGPPAGRRCAPPGPPLVCSYSARAARLLAGPVLFSCSRANLPAGLASLFCSRCQPAGWPCAFRAGSRGPLGPHPLRVPFTVRALAGLFASSSRPRRPTGGLEFHCFLSFQGFASAQGRITPRLPVGPPCRAAWARNPRGAESRLIAHACNEAHHVYSASSTVSSQLAAVRRKKMRLES
jgi:hypothetical protein